MLLQAVGAGLLPLLAWSGQGGQRGDPGPESEGAPPPRAARNALAPADMVMAASKKKHKKGGGKKHKSSKHMKKVRSSVREQP